MANTTTKIYLCSVNFRPEHQLRFDNETQQRNYFNSKVVSTHANTSYQDRLGTMKISGYVDTLTNCNYGFYENTYNGTTKRFYFWILEHHYKSRDTTELKIQLDVIQTWYFQYSMDVCFVERMHTSVNNRYMNLLEEDFDLGDYIVRKRIEIEDLKDTCLLLFVSKQDGSGYTSGKAFNALDCTYYKLGDNQQLVDALNFYINRGEADAIAYISIFPESLLKMKFPDLTSGTKITSSSLLYKSFEFTSEFLDSFSFRGVKYTPYNKKLLQYPFNFIQISNASGSTVVLKFENFTNSNRIRFSLHGVINPNPYFSLMPVDYCGRANSVQDSILTDGFGLCSWNNDNYATWYAQNYHSIRSQSQNSYYSLKTNNRIAQNNYDMNKVNRDMSLARSLVDTSGNIISAVGTANIGGAIGSGISGVVGAGIDYIMSMKNADNDLANSMLANQTNNINTINSLMASIKDAQVQPNTAKGDTSGIGLDVARETNTFFIDQIQIKPEYAERIDLYLQMFGLKVNTVTRPYINTREKWNYIKTVNARALGNIPEADKREIENQYNTGLTFWDNASDIGNYMQENAIRS